MEDMDRKRGNASCLRARRASEKYTGNRRGAATARATRRPRILVELVEIVVMPCAAKAAPPFGRSVAVGIGHAPDGEQRCPRRDAQQRRGDPISRDCPQLLLRAHDADAEL